MATKQRKRTNIFLRTIICCAILISCVSKVYAQRVTFNKGGINGKHYYEEIPYEFINGRIYLTPHFNGKKYKFLLDTGAPTQIGAELFKEIKAEVINKTDITDAAGNKTSLPIVSIKEFKLQGLVFNGIPALVSESELYKCLEIDGVLGSNVLRNSIVQINPAKHIVIITDDETKLTLDHGRQSELSWGEPQSYPFITVKLSDHQILKVGFDSGTYNFLRLSDKDLVKLGDSKVFEKLLSGYGASSRSLLGLQKPDSLFRLKLFSLNVNGSVFTNVVTETSKSNNSRLGTKLLDYGPITLDFLHHQFYFSTEKHSYDLQEKLWAFKPVIDQNKLVVGVVWESLKGKVNVGEEILEIDGKSCANMNLCNWVNGGSEGVMTGNTTTVKIKDKDGNVKEIQLSRVP